MAAESLFRYYKKVGPKSFFEWLDKHHEYDYMMKAVKKMDRQQQYGTTKAAF